MKISARAAAAAESATLKLSAAAKRPGVIDLLAGEPDLPPPPALLEAMKAALDRGETRYSASAGLPDLRKALAASMHAEDALVANGAKQALYEALQVLAGPGDEVIVLKPYWVTYPEAVKLAGAEPVFVEGPLDAARVAKAVTRRTRAVIVNSPNNPSGAVYPEAALRALDRLAAAKGFTVLSDEAYDAFVYDGVRVCSPASLSAAAAKRTVTVRTFSKTWSMTGLRVGAMAGPKDFIAAAARIHSHLTGNVCTPAQRAALAALSLPASLLEARRAEFERRRDLACALALPLFGFEQPSGSFFLWVDARRHLGRRFRGSAALADALLAGGVAVMPGADFGGEGFLRISFCQKEAVLEEGFARIRRVLCP